MANPRPKMIADKKRKAADDEDHEPRRVRPRNGDTELSESAESTPSDKRKSKSASPKSGKDEKKSEPVSLSSLNGAQTDMYLEHLVNREKSTYIHTVAMNLDDPSQKLRIKILRRALNFMLARHDALRSYFVETNKQIKQVTLPMSSVQTSDTWPLKVIDATHLKEPAELTALASTLKKLGEDAVLTNPLVPSKGPLWRAVLVRYSKKHYQLLFIFHHIIIDGNQAQNNFMRELSIAYRTLITGADEKEISLSDVPHLCDLPTLDVTQEKMDFWKKSLADYSSVNLSAESEQKCFNFQGKRIPIKIAEKHVDKIREQFVKPDGPSLHMTLLAALYVVLYRYTSSTDLCVLTPALTNRDTNAINCFVNTVPLRMLFSPELTFREFLDRVRKMAKTAYKNQVPIHMIPQIKTNSIMFVLNGEKTALDFPDIEASTPEELDLGVAKFENFAVSLDIKEGSLQGILEFGPAIKPESFQQFNQHLINVLKDATKYPDKKLSELDIHSKEDRQILQLSHQVRKQDKFHGFGYDLLTQCAQEFPTKKAAIFHYPGGDTESIAFKRLHDESKAIATFLQKIDCSDQRPVGISIARTTNLLIGYFGVMYAGACAVPLDEVMCPALEHKVNDTELETVLVDRNTDKLFNSDGIYTVNLSKKSVIHSTIASQKYSYEEPKLKSKSVVNIRYTSGTTSDPKGVRICHGGMRNLIGALMDQDIRADDKVLSIAPVTFDAFDFDWELAWGRGAEVHYAVEFSSPNEIMRIITENQITVATLPANLLKALGDPEKFPSLRYVITMGSALDDETRKKWTIAFAKRKGKFINGYGPTEFTIATSLHEYKLEDSNCNIGQPLPGNQAFIINTADGKNESPPGKPGELVLAGKQLACGFVARPDQTLAKFPCLFYNTKTYRFESYDEKKEEKQNLIQVYKTGDIAQLDPNSRDIIYLGREDAAVQVKISDTRLDLKAIHATLLKHSDLIKEVVVLATEDNKNLIAYAVPKQKPLTAKMINDILRETTLPSVARVSHVENLKNFPLTSNGKFDVKALRKLKLSKTKQDDKERPPSNVEKKLRDIWGSILSIRDARGSIISTPDIKLDDNFFDIGGDSRKAGLLEIEINDEFNFVTRFSVLEIPLKKFNIEEIANFIKKRPMKSESSQARAALFTPASAQSETVADFNPLRLPEPVFTFTFS